MAVSKLWPVTVRLATVLDYAANPEKTTKAKSKYSNADYQALRDVVNYVKDGKKTEQELFCQGINCNPFQLPHFGGQGVDTFAPLFQFRGVLMRPGKEGKCLKSKQEMW